MKLTQKEINIQFDEQPANYEVGEFLIYRDNKLDRRALYSARLSRFMVRASEVAVSASERAAEGLKNVAGMAGEIAMANIDEIIDVNFRGEDRETANQERMERIAQALGRESVLG